MPHWIHALERRAPLLTQETNAIRLIDGTGDGMPGIYLDAFADHWLLSTANVTPSPAFLAWLRSQPRSIYHKQLSQQEKDSPFHLSGSPAPEMFLAKENSMLCEISFHSGYSQGIFLDQRENRQRVHRSVLAAKNNDPIAILNTFAYTGAFSVAAALAGATTTTLDLSQPYLDWAKRNFVHNQLDPTHHHFCKGDTFHWLRRFQKQSRKYHGIILDPPTFSRDEKGKVFRVEKNFGELAQLAYSCLEKHGWLLCCTNCHQLSHREFEAQLRATLPKSINLTHGGMPSDFTESPYLKNIWIET
jgi:23S rRNA (cytosine1962-C5)-methyltransferase